MAGNDNIGAIKRKGNKPESYEYNRYLLGQMSERINDMPGFLANQTRETIAFRLMLAMLICALCFAALLFTNISVFSASPSADLILFMLCVIYSFCAIAFGFTFFILPLIGEILLLWGLYSLSGIMELPNRDVAISVAFASCFAAQLASGAVYIRWKLFDDVIDTYEKDSHFLGANIDLVEHAPISCFPRLITLHTDAGKSPFKDSFSFAAQAMKTARAHRAVMVGFDTSEDEGMTLYIYASTNSKLNSTLIYKIMSQAKACAIPMGEYTIKDDEGWETYFSILYPSARELCDIKCRRNMEELFAEGFDFDDEYSLYFELHCDKPDITERLSTMLGFYGLSKADCEGDIITYTIDSFVTSRRIKYLNEIIYRICEEYGASYSGDWYIE